jgi:hypothetical protein
LSPIAPIEPIRAADKYARNQIQKIHSPKKPQPKPVEGRKEQGKGELIDILA